MENTQFSFLTALFGGKFVDGKLTGDTLSNGKANLEGDQQGKDGEGFFTFIEGLLKPVSGANDSGAMNDVDASLAGSLFAGQPPIKPLDDNTIRQAFEGRFATPGTITGKFGPSTDPIGSPIAALALDAPQGETEPLGKDAALKPGTIPSGLAITPQAVEQTMVVAPQVPQKIGAALNATLSDQPAEAQDIELELDGRRRDGVSRFDAPTLKTHIDAPTLVLPTQANTGLAMAEHAAPDALMHSAAAREEVAVLDADRFAASRLEIISHSTGRTAHLNPIRDQVAAAVAARQGDGKLEIRLDPPELGRILIGFERDGTDIVRAVISADSPETLDLMRRHADVFQRALEAQGFENLDLHFADKGPGENDEEMTDETFKNFRLADEAGQADIVSSGPHLIDGRLDRRL